MECTEIRAEIPDFISLIYLQLSISKELTMGAIKRTLGNNFDDDDGIILD